MDRSINIDENVFALLADLLATGKAEKDGKSIDLSPVQTITISANKLILDPPAKVSAKVGPIRLKTTLSSIVLHDAKEKRIELQLDRSPIDIELKPKKAKRAWGF